MREERDEDFSVEDDLETEQAITAAATGEFQRLIERLKKADEEAKRAKPPTE